MKKMFVPIMCLILALPAAVCAGNVPHVLSFQSLFFDDGGNPIADGDIGATFKIIDTAGAVLYEEHQTLRAAGGFASALVGNGIAASGAPAGPIPASIFDAEGPLYLEVQLDGEAPMETMEIASVPFAMKSEIANKVADGAIETKAIADGGISFEDISAKAVDEIAKAVTGGRDTGGIVFREDLETMYRTPTSAATIGVKPNFIYSASNNLQDVLADFDRSIKTRDERVTSEKSARERGDSNLNIAITDETAARTALDLKIGDWETATKDSQNLSGRIRNETKLREDGDSGLYDRIGDWSTATITSENLSGYVKKETSLRDQGDSGLHNEIVAETSLRDQGDSGLYDKIGRWGTWADVAASVSVDNNSDDDNLSQRIEREKNLREQNAPRLISAWGSVNPDYQCDTGGDGSTFSGLGVGAVYCECRNGSSNLCDVTFATPMASTAYALVVTPSLATSVVSMTVSKATDKFTIRQGGHIAPFDFMVIGGQ